MTNQQTEDVVSMRGITMVYPNGVAANQGVDFSVRRGEIHALMGENGAGKSTLMKILFGMEQPTQGTIDLYGEKVAMTSPTAAIARGVCMVHQHFMLVPSLTVAENIVLGMTPKKGGMFIDDKKARQIALENAEKFNLTVDPDAKVMDIPVGMKQKVEILKALARGAKMLILDEPTAVLTTQETAELFRELELLKSQGYTIIFISHKLGEIKQITDRLSIMRGGRMMGTFDTDAISEQEISRLMVGRDVMLEIEKSAPHPGKPVLEVRELRYTNEWNKRMLDGVSFTVRAGEILGVAGVEGNGQRELVESLFGFRLPQEGSARVNGKDVLGAPQRKIRALGVSLVPEDRMTYGIADAASVEENVLSDRLDEKHYNRGPLFNMRAIHAASDQLIADYAVLCRSRKQTVKMLSGGNIQKVVVAREFSSEPTLIIADQPTRGIDVGATEFIRKKLISLARGGAAVLLVSADLNEVMELSDSLIVLNGGRIAAYFEDTSRLSDETMGEYMLGLRRQSAEEIGRAFHAE